MTSNRILLYGLLLILLLPVYISPQPENPGQLKAGWTSAVLDRNGRTLNCRVYYPAVSEGSEAPIDTSGKPYHVIAFGHGFLMQTSSYISLFKHLASYGYVVIAPQFPNTQHSELADDLLATISYIKFENKRIGSRFFQLIDTTKSGVFGHSMGGGASLLAASRDSTITVAAPLAAAETNPSAIAQMNQIKGAVYLIAGENDGITPVNNHQLPMFLNANPVKAILSIKGGNHTKFMDISTWDWTDPNGYISRTEQLRLTRRYLTGIFNHFLKEDTTYYKYTFGEQVLGDSSVIFMYELKPLIPFRFNLIFPNDTLLSPPHKFIWESTKSLNLSDTVNYELMVFKDSLLQDTFKIFSNMSDTSFITTLTSNTYYWKVRAYTSDSTYRTSNQSLKFIVPEPLGLYPDPSPEEFVLYQNFPNPFNPVTKIDFSLSSNANVRLSVYNFVGELVEVLVNSNFAAGNHSITFNANNLSSGIYLYKLEAGSFIQTKKMTILR
jgi:dienelactone hydrolase